MLLRLRQRLPSPLLPPPSHQLLSPCLQQNQFLTKLPLPLCLCLRLCLSVCVFVFTSSTSKSLACQFPPSSPEHTGLVDGRVGVDECTHSHTHTQTHREKASFDRAARMGGYPRVYVGDLIALKRLLAHPPANGMHPQKS